MEIQIITKISNICKKDWNNLNFHNHPFISHDFLYSLEESNSVSIKTGWQPNHIIVKNNKNKIVGALPNYLKTHSYGEYVFDHSWANAYEQAGGMYYPKLISAIPFTPVNGPRFLYDINIKNEVINKLILTLEKITKNNNLSSSHINFLTSKDQDTIRNHDWIERLGLQFHWENKNYKSFEDFLNNLKRQKRKMIKKERCTFSESDITFEKLTGDDLNSEIWDKFYHFYLNTINRKWGSAYLNREFFEIISNTFSKKILLIIAKKDNEIIAGALNFIGEDSLYGRNWGTRVNIPFLHFEICYYQAIDFAIKNNLKIVEAGAQGPHKINRGYIAKPTYSYHYIPNNSFNDAVRKFVCTETKEIRRQIEYVNKERNPFSNFN